MKVLSNIPWQSCSKDLEIVPFGSGLYSPVQYDYLQPLAEWIAENEPAIGKIDVLLFYLPEVHQLPNLSKGCPVPLVAILSDWNLNFSAALLSVEIFDYVLVDRRGFLTLRKMGYRNVMEFNCYGLHTGESESASESPEYSSEVLFIGNVSPGVQKNRGAWMRRLLALRDRFSVRVETNLFGDAYATAMKSARVVFNHSIRGEANMRVFETLVAGGVVFLESSNIEIRDYLEDRLECFLYDDDEMETTLASLLQDPCRLAEIKAACAEKRGEWNALARWDALKKTLEFCIGQVGQIERNSRYNKDNILEWFRWTCPVRKTPIEPILLQIDKKVEDSMSEWEAKQFIARCVLVSAPTPGLIKALRQICEALKNLGRFSIWSQLHFALVLEKCGERDAELEMEVWNDVLQSLDSHDSIDPDPYIFYTLPSARHYDLQNAIWNYCCPGALDNPVNLKRYLSHWALHRLGEIAISQGSQQDGLRFLNLSVYQFDGHSVTWIRIAECHSIRSREYVEALRRAFNLDPMNPDVGLRLLEALVIHNEKDEAKRLAWEMDGLLPLQMSVYPGSLDRNALYRKRHMMLKSLAN